MEDYGFKLLDREEAKELDIPEGSGLFNELFLLMIEQIKSQIEEKDIKHIKKQIHFAPVWIAKIMRSLIN